MKVPLLSGISADEFGEFHTSYPLNLEPLSEDSGIAKGQLRATAGATAFATGPGISRGAYVFKDVHFRVMGSKLVQHNHDDSLVTLGDVGNDGLPVTFTEGFDRLAIRSGTYLYYWDGTALTQVTDPNLGQVLDVMWIDGYFMTTDGNSLVVTELADPTAVDPLEYGSAEDDPDPIIGLIKWRNEAHALNRYTIQVYQNIGGIGFPYQNIPYAMIPYGCVGAMAKCLFADSFAFVGSKRNEALSIYLAGYGSATRISTREIDDALAAVADPSGIVLENRTSRSEQRLLVHLPNETLVYLNRASQLLGQPVWYHAQSGIGNPYRLRSPVNAYGRTIVGDTETAQLGNLSDTVSTHFGEKAQWRFDMGLIYGGAMGGVLHALELVGLPGRAPPVEDGVIFLSLTRDGENFTTERGIHIGRAGQHYKRLQWRPRTNFRTYLGMRVRGLTSALPGFSACEAKLTGLAA
jgi:hypothetical protein